MRKHPKAFYVYGEGSVSHSPDRPCRQFPGVHHPAIMRTEYRSRWHYRWTRLAEWLWERRTFHSRFRTYERNGKGYFTFGRIGDWLIGQAFPRLPHETFEIPRDKSIRDTDWDDWDMRTLEHWAKAKDAREQADVRS